MKRQRTNNEQVTGIESPSLEQPDAGTATGKKTREQELCELAMTVCEATRTPSLERLDTGTTVVKTTQEQLIRKMAMTVCEATGTCSLEVGHRIIHQVANAQVWPEPQDESDQLKKAVTQIREMAPQNATEAMLAVQMIAAHEAALIFNRRSTLGDQATEVIDANVQRATRLMRVFIQQLEAMQKMKGKAVQQQLTVDQVHVHQGGQAIVGSVNAPQEGR